MKKTKKTLKKFVIAIIVIAAFTGNAYAQHGNPLWKPIGKDTVFTNRNVKINKSLKVNDKITASVIEAKNYLKVGDSALYFVTYGIGDHIRSDLGRICLMKGDNTTFSSDVRVGIGTTNPTEKLHIRDGSIYVEGEGQGIIVNEGGHKRVGLMKYYGREAGIWRVINQDFEIGRLNVPSLPGIPTIFTIDLYIPCWRKFVTCA
jgi:hypothetical protein